MASPGRAFLLVFAVHLSIHGYFLSLMPRDLVRPHARWEINAVAMALYERGEFADPYAIPTGPTAHMPPFLPALMAGVYHLLGPTLAAGYVTWLLVISGYGAMYAMLPWLGMRLGLGAGAGLAAGLAGAVIPRWPGSVEGLAGVAIGLMAVAFLRRREEPGATHADSLVLGLALGLSCHVSPSLLPVALGFLVLELAGPGAPGRWRGVATVLLGLTLACVPWTVRNAKALGGVFFVRSNFGLELRMGNHEGAGATLQESARGGTERHPRTDLAEAEKVARLGELEYMRAAGREAVAWIRSNPGEFLRITALRCAQFWLGPRDDLPIAAGTTFLSFLAVVGAARSFPRLGDLRRAAILVPLATYPLVYYIVGYEARYRQPLDGLLLLLAAAAFLGGGEGQVRTRGDARPGGKDAAGA
ncbi:MAG: hypothetical protein KJ062_02970 [Thermoanaerobaculia bacterium]|nr:hypothetical protein [Thermoanaerobaculia bacterium]